MRLLGAVAAAWGGLVLLAPWLPVPIAGVVYLLGGRLCHQIAERSFYLDGAQLPVCARCLGIYVGAAVALLHAGGASRAARVRSRRRPVTWLVGAAALNVATVAIERLGTWPVSNSVRAAAGALLGIAVAVAIRHACSPTPAAGTVDYEQCPPPRWIRSALPGSRI